MEINQIIEAECSKWTQDKYAMYLRKSRADLELEALGEEETLARHKSILYALAAKNDIHPDQIEVYHEIVSGDSLDERPEAQRLLQDVHDQKFAAVLVMEIERLARGNTRDQGEVSDAFQFSSTKILTPVKTYNPDDESDQEYFEFGLFMSRREYKTIRRRLNTGKEQAVKEGNYLLPVPPYGFDIVKKSKKERYLVEKPEESRIVKMIFDWYTEERKSTSWISRQLTSMGIPTPRGNTVWARASVKDIIFNAHYTGKVSWGQQKTIRVKDPVTGRTSKKRIENSEPVLYEGKHDGFISEEQFWKVRTIYGTQAPTKMNTELVNPLSGILRCKDCDRAIGFIRFSCNRSARYQHHWQAPCKKPSVAADVLIDDLIQVLSENIVDLKVKIETNEGKAEEARHQAMVKAMQDELKKQEGRKRKLMDSWESEDGMYTRDEFIERKQMYTQKIDTLKEQIASAKKNAPAPSDYQEQIKTMEAIIACITDPDIEPKEKNIFLKKFIDKITYDVIDGGVNKKKPVLEVFLK